MKKVGHLFNCCRRAKWKGERVLFISMRSICSSSTAKACFRCHWRRARTFWKSSALVEAIPFAIPARLAETPSDCLMRLSGAWIKLKCVSEQEFVIGGYTPPQGSRKYFGAILVGYYEKKKLVFAGKVGSGFTAKSLSMLHKKFQKEARDDCPFVDLPSKQNGQWVQGITPSMMRKMHWVNPKFVCQIKFAEWTRDLKLRQPVFVGLREDKDPRDITKA